MYRITVVCSVKHFTCYIEEELHMKSILYDVQLLASHTLSAKCPTLNCDSSVRFGRANFADRMKILESIHLCYHEVLSVVIPNCCRNVKKSRHGVMAYLYCISKLVGNNSYGRCGVIQDVCYDSRM